MELCGCGDLYGFGWLVGVGEGRGDGVGGAGLGIWWLCEGGS